MIHQLKIKQQYAQAYYKGLKPWEIRLNDRNYQVGDIIEFTIIETGQTYQREIIYFFDLDGFGLMPNYCILTLSGYKYNL